ncbi:MAG: ABC transporter ATP-binding protein [Planctomycetes bacterium]|nr:ABC transporter ATP-binding protein [Planctomycetota bacterium]
MKSAAPEPIVDLQNVEKSFGPQRVLCGVDLKVYAGETVAIIGRSGTGKSVTIKHMVGLERPDSGRVLVLGAEPAKLSRRDLAALRLRMGYLFQSSALLNWMTIEQNVELPLLEHRRSMSPGERKERVLEKLRVVEMEEARHKFPEEVSGGMKKRAALARAIVLDPEIILYDEPTTGLDPVISRTIDELVLSTGRRLGSAQVVVTHDMASAYRVADRISMLYEGKIIAEGTPGEIQRCENPVVQQFITGDLHGPILGAARAI